MPDSFDLRFAVPLRLEAFAERLTEAVAEDLAARIRDKILFGPKTGHIYTVGPPPLPHQASAPGENPANWTGLLADSVLVEGNVVQVTAPYASDLEYGSPDGRVAPRPFFWQAVAEEAEFIPAIAHAVEIG